MKMFLNSFYSPCATMTPPTVSALPWIQSLSSLVCHFILHDYTERFISLPLQAAVSLSFLWFSFPACRHATAQSASLYHSPKFLACFLQRVAAETVPVIMAFDEEYPRFPEDGQSHSLQLVVG